MCSFLQVQVWHRETGRVVSRLGSEAAAVAERLEKSGSLQADILLAQQQALNNQQQALDNQQQLISHGRRLSHDVDRWRDSLYTMVQEFREQTDEHRDLILTVFERLTSLQQLVLDRFSWFNSLAHYLAGVLLVYLLTATARTSSARPWLFLVLTCNLALERLLAAYLLSPSPLHPRDAQETAAALERGVWLLRRAAGTLCLLLLAGAVYRYRDLNAANNRLLQELHKQHLELRRCLAANGMPLSSVSEPDWSNGNASNLAGAALYQTPSPKAAHGASKERRRGSPQVSVSGVDVSLCRRSSGLACGPGEDTVDVAGAVRNGVVSELGTSRCRTIEEPAPTVAALRRAGSRGSPTPPSRQLLLSRHCPAPPPLREGAGMELELLSHSPTPQRSRSGTPQPATGGRYNLRTRSGAVSPESLSRRLGALASEHDTLVRRALRQS